MGRSSAGDAIIERVGQIEGTLASVSRRVDLPEHQPSPLGDRRPDHASSGLRREPAHPQADRGRVRLDQGGGPAAACPASRQGSRRLAIHPGGGGLQPDPATQAAPGVRTKAVNRDLYSPHDPSRPRPTVNPVAQNSSRSHPMPKSDTISAAC